MSGEIVNLRRVRKQRGRQEADAVAAQNRILFGRPRADRELAARQEERAARHLDGHRLGGDAAERDDGI